MILYPIIIGVASILLITINTIIGPESFLYYLIATLIFIAAAFIIDALVAAIVRSLPEKWFDEKKKVFQVSKKEMNFLNKLQIKKWKDLVPVINGKTTTDKTKIEDPNSNEYLSKCILEACYGIVVHTVSFFASFLILFIDYKMFKGSLVWLRVGVPVAVINACLIGVSALILKYNLYRIRILYNHNLKLQNKKSEDK